MALFGSSLARDRRSNTSSVRGTIFSLILKLDSQMSPTTGSIQLDGMDRVQQDSSLHAHTFNLDLLVAFNLPTTPHYQRMT